MFIHFVYDPILLYIYMCVAYLYSNYCCIFGILTAFSPGTKLVWMLLSGRQSISMDSFGSYSNCRSLTVYLSIKLLAYGMHIHYKIQRNSTVRKHDIHHPLLSPRICLSPRRLLAGITMQQPGKKNGGFI